MFDKHLPAKQEFVTVCGVPNCFNPQKRVMGKAPAYRTLAQIKADACRLARVPGFWSCSGTLLWNYQTVPEAFWDKITAAPGDRIDFVAAPAGKVGNMLLKVVGAIAMMVGAVLAPMTGGTSLGLSYSALGWGLMVGGLAVSMAADYIAPIPMPSLGLNQGDKSSSPTYSLNGSSNNMRYGQPIPRIYGRYRVPPTRILDDYTELEGQEEYLNFLGVIGYGPLLIELDPESDTVRIGDNTLDNYGIEVYDPNDDDQEGGVIQITEGVLSNGSPVMPDLIDRVVYQDNEQIKLETRDAQGEELPAADWWVTRSLNYEVTSLSFDLQAPQGIYHLNDDADREPRSVKVEMQYRRTDLEEEQPWTSASGTVKKASVAKRAYLLFDEADVKRNSAGRSCYAELDDGVWKGTASKSSSSVCKITTTLSYDSGSETSYIGYQIDATYADALTAIGASGVPTIGADGYDETVVFPSYSYVGAKVYTLSGIDGSPANPVRKTFTVKRVTKGVYEMRIRRKTLQSDSTKDVGDVYWTALRGFSKSDKIYTGKKPISMIAMRIKATNQLQGSLPVVTVLATSKLRDWNGTNWNTVRATRNPASIFLDILTGTANERPKTDAQVDLDNLAAWHEWCDTYGYTCDMVFDTQTNVWDALCQVCACGRGSPNIAGGKWGVVWAHKQEGAPVGHITARNTKAFSSSKTYITDLHGLHVTFQDEDNDYDDTVIDVYAKGKKKSNASLFEGIELTGITNETQAAYMGWFRLYQMLRLPEQYSVTMPLEYMRLQKNDKVRVVRDEIGYGIGAASIVSFTTANSKLTSLTWDAPLSMTPGTTYLAVVRLGDGSELSCTGTADDGMTFVLDTPVSYTVEPRPYDLVMVGTAETVGRECIVTSIKPRENLTAEVTLMDYIDELYENDGGAVPAYDACITIAGKLGRKLKKPTITLVRSDEWALSTTGEPRLFVRWKYNDKSVSGHLQFRRVLAGVADDWQDAGNAVNGNSLYAYPVEESWDVTSAGKLKENGITYDVRVQAIDANTGYSSAWTTKTGIKVTGRTSYPQNVGTVTISCKAPEGLLLTWPRLAARDIAFYSVTGSLSGDTAVNSVILQPWEMTGALSFSVYAVDTIGLKSKFASTASITIYAPYVPAFSSAALLDEGIVAEYAATARTWPVSMYELKTGSSTVTLPDRRICIPVPVKKVNGTTVVQFKIGQTIAARAQDIFKNWSASSAARTIDIYYPSSPDVTIGADAATAEITLDWQNCQHEHDGSPRIDHYEIEGVKASGIVSVKGTHYAAVIPLSAYVAGKGSRTLTVTVTAFDKYNITNQDNPDFEDNSVSLTIYPPLNPASIETIYSTSDQTLLDAWDGKSIELFWRDCTTTFAIKNYVVVDTNAEKTYMPNVPFANLLKRKAGAYELTIQAIDVLGQTSDTVGFSMVVPLPPNVGAVTITRKPPEGLLLTWADLDHRYFSFYRVTGALSGETYTPSIILEPWEMTGTLTFNTVAVNEFGDVSATPSSKSITLYAPYAPTFSSAELLDEGIVAVYSAVARSWPLSVYELSRGNTVITTSDTRLVMPVEVRRDENDNIVKFAAGLPMYARVRDIFKNWSEDSDPRLITVYYPKAPAPSLGYDKRNGAITVDWQDCQNDHDGSPRIDHYEISGTLTTQQAIHAVEKVQGTHFESFATLTAYEYGAQTIDGIEIEVGTISITVTAVDKYGITDKDNPSAVDNTVTLSIIAPYSPTDFALSTSAEGDILLSWKDCESTFAIDYYIVRDTLDNATWKEYKTKTNNIALPARTEGTYSITVQAFDMLGKESARMTYNMIIGGVGGMEVTAKVDGSEILLEWSIPDSSFTIDYYIIKRDNDIIPSGSTIDFDDGTQIGTAKVNYFRVPGGTAGSYTYYVWAVDVAGNISTEYASFASVTISAPLAPTVAAALDSDGVAVSWVANMDEERLTVIAWDVIRQWDETDDNGTTTTKEMDYGRVDASTITVPPFIVADGTHTFLVRGVDSGGNLGEWGEIDFIAKKPGKVTITQPNVIDNNVQLYWTLPDVVFFPIKEYLFSEIEKYDDGTEYEMEIGTVDAMFAFTQENISGSYTYGITPVDAAGNVGERTMVTLEVSQPPDFVFYHDLESLFNGSKTNLVLDGNGHMLGPVPTDETWTENIERASLLSGTTIETHQQKVNAGYKTWLEPVGVGLKLAKYDNQYWGLLYWQDSVDGTNIFPSKDDCWDYQSEDGTLFSKLYALRDYGDQFRLSDGNFEFLYFQSDENGPITGDSTKYVRFAQTDNPATTYYGDDSSDASGTTEGLELIESAGTSRPWYGLALSSAANTLFDQTPKNSSWWGGVALYKANTTYMIAALEKSRYAQLWVRLPETLLAGFGQYVETVDVGMVVPSSKITVNMTYRTISGSPEYTCKVEVSEDGTEWRTVNENSFVVYAKQFRYCRYTITVTGGYAEISSLKYDLNVKRRTDFGRVQCNATDNGDGWTSETDTPMLTGTWVPFNVEFIDVDSIPKPNVVKLDGSIDETLTAFVVFEDVSHPLGFRIFVKDTNGTRQSAVVDWAAYGV